MPDEGTINTIGKLKDILSAYPDNVRIYITYDPADRQDVVILVADGGNEMADIAELDWEGV